MSSGVKISALGWPIASAALQPKIRSDPPDQLVIRPSASRVEIAWSLAPSTISRSRSAFCLSSVSASLRSVMSIWIPSQISPPSAVRRGAEMIRVQRTSPVSARRNGASTSKGASSLIASTSAATSRSRCSGRIR
jgi:hypothetical protein